MKRTISAFLAALLIGTSSFAAAGTFEERKTEERAKSNIYLGSEAISLIRDAYEKGFYDEFTMKMEADYRDALEANQLDGLVEMRQDSFVDTKNWESRLLGLQSEKNEALRNLVAETKNPTLLTKKINSVASSVSSVDQERAASKLASFAFMTPGSGSNSDENQLIDLDLEYEYKLTHLQTLDLTQAEKNDQQIVLRMEKMDKIKEASKNFQDPSLKEAVALASANLDAKLAQNWDARDLNALASGMVKATDSQEAAVATILSSYQAKFNDLFKEIAKSDAQK